MSVLFEEQNSAVLKHAAEAILPTSSYEGVLLHHEGLHLKNLEQAASQIGGRVSGHTVMLEKEEYV